MARRNSGTKKNWDENRQRGRLTMILHFLFAGLVALALARPETYKENEEFNYSRSSTDEGSKSGFYEAQRGNTGGNFELAHNMDTQAQGQMSDLINQVGTQVDTTNANKGNLYGAGYTRGVYGRHYDASNLANRNFNENVGQSSSLSSGSSSSQYAGQYNRDKHGSLSDNFNAAQHGTYGSGTSQNAYGTGSGYGTSNYGSRQHSSSSGFQQYSGSQRASRLEQFDEGYVQTPETVSPYRIVPVRLPEDIQANQQIATTSNHGSRQHSSSSGYQQYSGLHQASSNLEQFDQGHIQAPQTISSYRVVPVRVVVRPMEPVKLPVDTQATQQIVETGYNQRNEQSRSHSQQSAEQNSGLYNSGLNVGTLNNAGGLDAGGIGKEKHYESSYNYHKEWEKHSEVTPVPLSIPTVNPLSEPYNLYNQQQLSSQSQRNIAADSSYRSTNQNIGTQALQGGAHEKSYESGYNYKKQWEKQSAVKAPTNRYVVLSPSTDVVVTGVNQGAYGSSNSQHAASQSHQVSGYRSDSRSANQRVYADQGLLRTNNDNLASGSDPKKYESSYSYHKSWERQGDPYIIYPATGPASGQSERLQTNAGHYTHGHSHGLQDDCDDTQRKVRSANYAYSSEDLGQQVEDMGQQMEDLGQELESTWQVPASIGIDYSGQQVENTWDQHKPELDLGQQVENSWGQDMRQDVTNGHYMGQQVDTTWGSQKLEDVGQKVENSWGNHNYQHLIANKDMGQQVDNSWSSENREDMGQQVQKLGDETSWRSSNKKEESKSSVDLSQQGQISWSQNNDKHFKDIGQEVENTWALHKINDKPNGQSITQDKHNLDNTESVEQQLQSAQNGYSEWQSQYNQYLEHNMAQIEQAAHDLQQQEPKNWGIPKLHEHYNYFPSYQPVYGNNWNQRTHNVEHSYSQAEHVYGREQSNLQEEIHNYEINKDEDISQLNLNNINIEKNRKDTDITVLRGDLGTPTPLQKFTTVKPTTEDVDKHLKEILSTIDESITPITHSVPSKIKSQEEIESLSLVRDTKPDNNDMQTNNKTLRHKERDIQISHFSIPDYVPYYERSNQNEHIISEHDSYHPDFYTNEKTDENNDKIQTYAQEAINVDQNEQLKQEVRKQEVNTLQENRFYNIYKPTGSNSHKYQSINNQEIASGQSVNTYENRNEKQDDQELDHIVQKAVAYDQQSEYTGQEAESLTSSQFNVEQQSEDLGQQVEDLGQHDEHSTQQLEDLGQQVEDFSQRFENDPLPELNVQQTSYDTVQITDPEPEDDEDVKQNEAKYYSHQSTANVEKMVEQPLIFPAHKELPAKEDEKPGFWKNVGNKLGKAKDSISSWFKG